MKYIYAATILLGLFLFYIFVFEDITDDEYIQNHLLKYQVKDGQENKERKEVYRQENGFSVERRHQKRQSV